MALSAHSSAPPAVSIVIVNWNAKELTARCLASLRAQTFRDFEVVVVDNGSSDGSAEALRQEFPEVELIALRENRGFAGGSNAGIRRAHGRYIALLNNDAEADPRWLEELIKAAEAHPEMSFFASKMVLYDCRERLDSAGDYYSIAGTAGKRGHLDRANRRKYNHTKEVFGACGGAALYRRELLEDVGLFDEDFFLAHEDTDLNFRAQLRGYRCLYVPTAVVYHRLSATIRPMSERYVYYGHRNLEYVYVKNMPGLLLGLTLPLHIVDELLSFGFFLLQGQGGAFLRAKWDVLRVLPKLIRKRREIQRTRQVGLLRIASLLEWRWLCFKARRLLQLVLAWVRGRRSK